MRTAQTDNAGNRLDRRELAAFVDDNAIDVIFQQSVQYFLMCNGKVAAVIILPDGIPLRIVCDGHGGYGFAQGV